MTGTDTARDTLWNAAYGCTIILLILLQSLMEWTGLTWPEAPAALVLLVVVAFLVRAASPVGRAFLAVSAALTIGLILTRPDWGAIVWPALVRTGFLAAFFCSLSLLRNVAQSSPAMATAGTYLASQPPGRRYLALTTGAHAFALVLNYGAIQLLGTLSLTSARTEPDDYIRNTRIRRMLLAVHRGFVSSLSWSPLAFSIVVIVSVIPGTSWSGIVGPGLVIGVMLLGTGWAMDTIFKPRPSGRKPAVQDPGHWTALLPLGGLMLLMLATILLVEETLHVRVIGIVLVAVPVISMIWLAIQLGDSKAWAARMKAYVVDELPGFRREVLLIASASYIGITGSALALPWMEASGFDLGMVPTWLLLLALLWIVPALGQIGANPILSVSLIGPLLPPAAQLGVTPTALANPLLCGWLLTGLTSPFTAVTLLIARFGGISPLQVAWDWNRAYFIAIVALLSGWTLVYAYVLT
ncbi:hypothetical protein [Marinibacterium profundimaris]|uniref:hypothetical protein n=1 Tax=Marinibacterium profundimaris TaxID=1679460 RepID=UPI000B525AE6|nr:hypothetical protein [Marinibacterium profundimaris]